MAARQVGGHKLKVLAGRRESVERQLCDYLTVRLEFSSLFSLHTLRASLKYCSSPSPKLLLLLCFFFLWNSVVSLAYMYVYVCMYMQIDGFCLSLESFHAARAHSVQSQNSQIRWKSFLTFNDARTVSQPPLTTTSTATATSSKWANVFSWDLRKVSAKSFLSFRLLAKRQRQPHSQIKMLLGSCPKFCLPSIWPSFRAKQCESRAPGDGAPASIINLVFSLVPQLICSEASLMIWPRQSPNF